MTSDATLIARTLGGEADAYGELVRKHQPAITAIALQRLRSAVEAEEVAQVVFVTAYRKLGQLRDPDKFEGWLRSIAVRQCSLHRRSEARRREKTTPFPGGVEAVAAKVPAPGQGGGGLGLDIKPLVGRLPTGLKAAAELCLVDGWSPAAAAAALGLNPGTLRKRLFDARARLQRWIVARAETDAEIHLLPRDFAECCVCRCERAAPRGRR